MYWPPPCNKSPYGVKKGICFQWVGCFDVDCSAGQTGTYCSIAFRLFPFLLDKEGTEVIDTTIVPRRQRHTTHLEKRRLTIEFASTIQYWLLITLSVIPLPAWATFLWASRTIRPPMKHLFGRIIGCLKSSENYCDLLSLPPTRMIPFWYKILDFLISDFFI